MITTAVIGIDTVQKKLKSFNVDTDDAVEEVVTETASYIQNEAKKNARRQGLYDFGHLIRNIVMRVIDNHRAEVVSGAHYSPYMEFGTGREVEVPPEWNEIAIQFKGKGLKKVNIMPRPFMYPAYLKGRRRLIVEAKKRIDKFVKNYQ